MRVTIEPERIVCYINWPDFWELSIHVNHLLFVKLDQWAPIHSSHEERLERPRQWYCVSPCITGVFYSAFYSGCFCLDILSNQGHANYLVLTKENAGITPV